MSCILTATLPGDVNLDLVKPIISRFGKGFEMLNNRHVISQIPKNYLYFKASKECNDNNTTIGLVYTNLAMMEENRREIPMFTYGGWHGALKDDWTDRCISRLKKLSKEQTDELITWIDFLKEILYYGNVKEIGILKHYYSEDAESERFYIKKIEKVSIENVNLDYLLYIQEDTLYEFVK